MGKGWIDGWMDGLMKGGREGEVFYLDEVCDRSRHRVLGLLRCVWRHCGLKVEGIRSVRGSLIKEAGGKGREEEGEACEGFMENMQCK